MINFDDVSGKVGISTIGRKSRIGSGMGVAWADFNGDTLPDLYSNNHWQSYPRLYQNEGDGTLTEVFKSVATPLKPDVDNHGAAWADFDNDGDSDLIQVAGWIGNPTRGYRPSPNQLFVNESSKFVDRASNLGISDPKASARGVIWLDFDHDGQIDLFEASKPRSLRDTGPPTIFRQTDEGFEDIGKVVGLGLVAANSGTLSDLSGDGKLDLVVLGSKKFREGGRVFAYDITSNPVKKIPLGDLEKVVFEMGSLSGQDVATADFNGDLRIDLFLSKGSAGKKNSKLFLNTSSGFVEKTTEAGIAPHGGKGAVVGDFDNDMDTDLYITDGLYENQGNGTFDSIPKAGKALAAAQHIASADYDLDGFLDLFVAEKPDRVERRVGKLFRNQGNSNHWLEIDLEGVNSNRDGIGASVIATAGGVKQLREQSGGSHRFSQNYSRLHFGLADNTVVDQLEVRWPSGKTQTIENIPADQLIRIVEPSGPTRPGQPDFASTRDAGVFLWQDTFDGPYHLRIAGKGEPTQFSINLLSSNGLEQVTPQSLETTDQLQTADFGVSLNSHIRGDQDGFDFQLAPASTALLSVTQDGVANPRQLYVGDQSSHLSPAGWVLDSQEFPKRPAFTPGKDLGLFLGQGATPEELESRWSGDGKVHQTALTVLASESNASFTPKGLNPKDNLSSLQSGVAIESRIGSDSDGLDVSVAEPSRIGFTYQQDGLFQSHRVNALDDLLGSPNAYELPVANPYGQPDYEASQDAGLFLWKDEQEGVWELRATGGGEAASFAGSIVADRGAQLAQPVGQEANDTVDTSDPLRVDFDLKVSGSNIDGFRFRFPDAALVSLELEGGAAPLRIGSEQWRVSQVPLSLNGWS